MNLSKLKQVMSSRLLLLYENNDDETNYAQLLENWINDKMKMDRRFFPMQDIKVRQS